MKPFSHGDSFHFGKPVALWPLHYIPIKVRASVVNLGHPLSLEGT